MLKKTLMIVLFIFMLTGVSSAVSMQVSPPSINPGETIQIAYADLLDGSSFSLQIKGKLDVNPGSEYTMNINSLVIPISLSDGTIRANADNSLKLALNYEGSKGTIKTITQFGDSTDSCSISERQSISAKTYDNMWIDGIASDGNVVNTELHFIGKKTGPDSGIISLTLSGIDHSTITIICSVDGVIVTNTPVAIGGGSVSTPDAVSQTSNSGSNSDTAYSLDTAFQYTGKGASGAIIMFDSADSLPSGWNNEGDTYALISDGTDIAGTIRFKIPASFRSAEDSDRLFIGKSVNGQWVMLPSVVNGEFIESSVSEEGTFALMSLTEPSSDANAPGATETQSAGISGISIILVGLALLITVKLRK